MNVVIIDYGSANYASLINFFNNFEKLKLKVSSNKRDISNSDLLVLPGVGAFDNAIRILKKKKIDKIIKNEAFKGKPIIGICLGMQILFESSKETKNDLKGLCILDGKTDKLNQTNVGWKNLISKNKIFKQFNKKYFYFNHSFLQICNKKYILCHIKINKKNIPAIIQKGNIFGFQFHPENSQTNGIEIMDFILKRIENNV